MAMGLMLTRPSGTLVNPTKLYMILTPPTLTENAAKLLRAYSLLHSELYFTVTAFIVFYGSRDVMTAAVFLLATFSKNNYGSQTCFRIQTGKTNRFLF